MRPFFWGSSGGGAGGGEPVDLSPYALIGYVDAAVAAVSGSNNGAPTSGVASGCGVAYSGLLNFAMSAGSYYLDGALLTAAAQSVTLVEADATNPRIDTLYVDASGTFGRITGTPAASPSPPPVDPNTQLYLTFVLVPAAAVNLDAGILTETLYNEGGEWTASTSGSGFTLGSTNNPSAGTVCIEGTAVATGAYVKFVDGSPTAFGGDGNLLLPLRSKATWNSKRSLTLQWYASGVAVGSPVTVKEGSFGFNSATINAYQLLIVAKSLFAIPATTTVDELRITAAGSGGSAIGLYLDNIRLQTTGTTTGGSTTTGLTQEQADARYLRQTSAASNSETFAGTEMTKFIPPGRLFSVAAPVAVNYAASVALDGNTGINFEIGTLTGNLTLANPTNMKVGQSGTIRLVQDGTGGRTISFGSNWRLPGGAAVNTLSTAAGAVDVIAYLVRAGGIINATLSKDFKA